MEGGICHSRCVCLRAFDFSKSLIPPPPSVILFLAALLCLCPHSKNSFFFFLRIFHQDLSLCLNFTFVSDPAENSFSKTLLFFVFVFVMPLFYSKN